MRRKVRWAFVSLSLTGLVLLLGPGAPAAVGAEDEEAELAAELQAAAAEASRFSFEEAYNAFGRVMQEATPGSEIWREAAFGRAISAQHRLPPGAGLIAEAERLFGEIIESAPQSPLAARSMLTLGRIRELRDYPGDEIDLPAAIGWYEKVLATYPELPIRHEATVRLAGAYIQQFEDESAVRKGIGILEAYLAAYPTTDVNPLAGLMWQYLGDSYFSRLGDEPAALEAYLKAVDVGLIDIVQAGKIYWRTAVLAERAGRPEVAIAFYQRIITETPRSGRAYESQLALKRLREETDDPSIAIPEIKLFRD
ncbi:MAG: tetratricopeptide repeat protein [Phycisphaerae bacterium]